MTADRSQDFAAATSAQRRYQMLDVWRGVVCLVVVLEHAGVVLWPVERALESGWEGWLQGWLVSALQWNFGSMLFFVMSGYCIASSLAGARRRGDSPARFLSRRLWRIYPTYWAALLAFVAFVVATDALGFSVLHHNGVSLELISPAKLDLRQWLGNLTLTETWRQHLGGHSEVQVFTRVAWSLCYQEQFYFICMLALWLAPRRLELALAGATAVIVGFRVIAADIGALSRFEGSFPVYWHFFAVGLAVYWRLNLSAGSPAWGRRLVEIVLLMNACDQAILGRGFATAAPYAFGVLLIGMWRWDATLGISTWLAPIRACGRRSFSIYLIHLPVTMVGNHALVSLGLDAFWARALVILPMVTAASVAVGWVFHRVVERHFLGQPPVFPKSTPAGSSIAFGSGFTVHAA